jgi:hypothetical protein
VRHVLKQEDLPMTMRVVFNLMSSSERLKKIFLMALVLRTGHALAVDPQPIVPSMASPYFLIGVIGDARASDKGVAVLKDTLTQKTVTCKVGDKIPGQNRYTLQKVLRHMVVLNDQGTLLNVFQESQAPKNPEPVVGSIPPGAGKESDDSVAGKVLPQASLVLPSVSETKAPTDTIDPALYEDAAKKYKYYPREPGLFEKWYSALNGTSDTTGRTVRIAPNGESMEVDSDDEDLDDDLELINSKANRYNRQP